MRMILQSRGLWKNCEYEDFERYLVEMKKKKADTEKRLQRTINDRRRDNGQKEIKFDENKDDEVIVTTKEMMDWMNDDEKCVAMIGLSLSDRFITTIKQLTTAYEIWNKIKELASTNNSAMKLTLKCQFYEAKMTEKETLVNYVDRIEQIVEKLDEIGSKTEEKEVCYKILSSIPEKYKPIVLTCFMIPENDLTISKLRQSFALESSNKQQPKQREALVFEKKQNNNFKGNNQQKQRICYKCGLKNHISPDCHASQEKIDKYTKQKEDDKKKNNSNKNNNNQKKEQTSNVEIAMNITCSKQITNQNSWYIDSGCTQHMTNDKTKLFRIRSTNTKVVGPISKESKEVSQEGDCRVRCVGEDEEILDVRLEKVLFVQDIRRNLISVKNLCQKGAKVEFEGESVRVTLNDRVIMRGNRDETGLFAVKEETTTNHNEETQDESVEENDEVDDDEGRVEDIEVNNVNILQQWHERLGHLSYHQIIKLNETNKLEGLTKEELKKKIDCDSCEKGKKTTKKFKKINEIRTKERGEIIHSDICGPITPSTIGGNRYFISFIDDFTRKSWIFIIKSKDQALNKFKELNKLFINQYNINIKSLVSDGGGEYLSNEFKEYLEEEGIIHRITPPYTPERNGVAERYNRTIIEKVRSMLAAKKVDKSFWGEAANTANQLRNYSPTSLKANCPEQEFSANKPNLNNLRVFGSRVLIKNKKKSLKKLDDKTKEGMFLGYNEENKTFRVWDIERKEVISSRDVTVKESEIINQSKPDKDEDEDDDSIYFELDVGEVKVDDERKEGDDQPRGDIPEEKEEGIRDFVVLIDTLNDNNKDKRKIEVIDLEEEEDVEEVSDDDNQNNLRRSTRDKTETKQFGKVLMYLAEEQDKVPINYHQMLKSEEREKWLESTQQELNSLTMMNTWTVIDRKERQPTITAKWLWKIKYLPTGQIDKFKTRMVARGYTQKKGINYEETFAPVVRFETLRYLLAYSVKHKLAVHHMDVETAFLNGNLEEEIFMEIPEGLEFQDNRLILRTEENNQEKNEKNQKVLKLNKSIYGLKQSPRCWNIRLTEFLTNQGYQISKADPCVFIKINNNQHTVIAVYVDDCFIIGKDKEIEEIKLMFHREFKMKDNKELKGFLGINVVRDEKKMSLDQQFYIENVLKRFGMQDCKPISTPMIIEKKKEEEKKGKEKKMEDISLYQSAIGSLIYLSTATRPDITYAVHQAAQAMKDPSEDDWIRVKRIFRYLQGTKTMKIIYSTEKKEGEEEDKIFGYSDASYAEDRKDRKSTSGYLFIKSKGPISWKSKKQPIVSLSSMEAEYIALTAAAKEAIWLSKIETELGENKENKTITIKEDNQSTIKTANDVILNERSKHIDVRYHFIRELIKDRRLKIDYLPTTDMIADMLTKPLGSIQLEKLNKEMGLHQ